MKTKERQVVEKLLRIQFLVWAKVDALENLGISFDIETSALLDPILDLIGFPADNSSQFDLHGYYSMGSKRTDFDNMFCRDYLTSQVLDDFDTLKMEVSFSELADRLYAAYEAYQSKN